MIPEASRQESMRRPSHPLDIHQRSFHRPEMRLGAFLLQDYAIEHRFVSGGKHREVNVKVNCTANGTVVGYPIRSEFLTQSSWWEFNGMAHSPSSLDPWVYSTQVVIRLHSMRNRLESNVTKTGRCNHDPSWDSEYKYSPLLIPY
jgi:hypothetical protein